MRAGGRTEHTTPELLSICPHFIVKEYRASVDYYRDKLGFTAIIEAPGDDPFFAVVRRSGVTIALKEIASDVLPMPNCSRHEYARWDAFVDTLDPDALYEEYCAKGVTIHKPLTDIAEGLRAFEIQDINGYVLCFGRPLE
jgi:uncharacterized glyoxalase superfamily protein PhnB